VTRPLGGGAGYGRWASSLTPGAVTVAPGTAAAEIADAQASSGAAGEARARLLAQVCVCLVPGAGGALALHATTTGTSMFFLQGLRSLQRNRRIKRAGEAVHLSSVAFAPCALVPIARPCGLGAPVSGVEHQGARPCGRPRDGHQPQSPAGGACMALRKHAASKENKCCLLSRAMNPLFSIFMLSLINCPLLYLLLLPRLSPPASQGRGPRRPDDRAASAGQVRSPHGRRKPFCRPG